MSALSEKMRRAREQRVPVGGYFFVIRRPTDLEMIAFARTRQSADLLRHVVGWEQVREMDLLPGGDPHPAPFDADACAEWLSDRADLMGPVVEAIVDSYKAHKEKAEQAAKN